MLYISRGLPATALSPRLRPRSRRSTTAALPSGSIDDPRRVLPVPLRARAPRTCRRLGDVVVDADQDQVVLVHCLVLSSSGFGRVGSIAFRVGRRPDRSWLDEEVRSPSSITALNRAPAPPPLHRATSRARHLRWPASPRSCWTPRITRWSICAVAPPWLNDIRPPSVVDRVAALRARCCRPSTKSGRPRRLAEPERLELADDLEGERVVELAARPRRRATGRPCAKRLLGRPPRRPSRSGCAVGDRAGPSWADAGRPARSGRGRRPRMCTGVLARSAARSAVVMTSAQPPSEVIEQSRRWNGSATIREARMSSGVNGPRP